MQSASNQESTDAQNKRVHHEPILEVLSCEVLHIDGTTSSSTDIWEQTCRQEALRSGTHAVRPTTGEGSKAKPEPQQTMPPVASAPSPSEAPPLPPLTPFSSLPFSSLYISSDENGLVGTKKLAVTGSRTDEVAADPKGIATQATAALRAKVIARSAAALETRRVIIKLREAAATADYWHQRNLHQKKRHTMERYAEENQMLRDNRGESESPLYFNQKEMLHKQAVSATKDTKQRYHENRWKVTKLAAQQSGRESYYLKKKAKQEAQREAEQQVVAKKEVLLALFDAWLSSK